MLPMLLLEWGQEFLLAE